MCRSRDDKTSNALSLARRRAKAKLGFGIHLAVYGVITTAHMFESIFFSPTPFAFVGQMAGWGLGVLFHGLAVFAKLGGFDRLVEEERRRLEPPK